MLYAPAPFRIPLSSPDRQTGEIRKRYPNDRIPARYSIVFFDSFFSESFLGTLGAMLYGCSPAGGRFRAGYVCAAFSPFPPVPNALVCLAAVPVFLARAVFSPYRTGRFPCLPVHSRKRTAIAGAVPFGSYSIQGTRRTCCGARRSPHPDCSGGILFRTSSPVETFGSPRCDISIKQGCCCRAGPQAVFTRPLAPEELPRTAPFGSRSIRGSGGFLSWGLCPSRPARWSLSALGAAVRFGGFLRCRCILLEVPGSGMPA